MATDKPKKAAQAGTPPMQAEAEGRTHITIDVSDDWPMIEPFSFPIYRADQPATLHLAALQNNALGMLSKFLPADSFEAFIATDPTMRQVDALNDRITTAIGLAQTGESPGSSD